MLIFVSFSILLIYDNILLAIHHIRLRLPLYKFSTEWSVVSFFVPAPWWNPFPCQVSVDDIFETEFWPANIWMSFLELRVKDYDNMIAYSCYDFAIPFPCTCKSGRFHFVLSRAWQRAFPKIHKENAQCFKISNKTTASTSFISITIPVLVN